MPTCKSLFILFHGPGSFHTLHLSFCPGNIHFSLLSFCFYSAFIELIQQISTFFLLCGQFCLKVHNLFCQYVFQSTFGNGSDFCRFWRGICRGGWEFQLFYLDWLFFLWPGAFVGGSGGSKCFRRLPLALASKLGWICTLFFVFRLFCRCFYLFHLFFCPFPALLHLQKSLETRKNTQNYKPKWVLA